jgi:protein-tyrosine phosphatase
MSLRLFQQNQVVSYERKKILSRKLKNVGVTVANNKKQLFVYQGQNVHLFCPSLGFLAEAQPRLENRRAQKALVT